MPHDFQTWMVFFFWAAVTSSLVGWFATHKNRSFWRWFVFSILLSPLLGFIILIFMKKLPWGEDKELKREELVDTTFEEPGMKS